MLITSLVLLKAGQVNAQAINELSVNEAVDYAMKNSVQVRNALVDIKLQQAQNKEITSAALPQISGNASATRYFDIPTQLIPNFIGPATYQVLIDEGVTNGSGNPITMPSNGFGMLPFQFGTNWTATAGVDLSQLLFDGQVFVGLQARNAAMQFSRLQADVTREQIKANIQKIYYQLVVGRQQMTSIDANIDRFDKLLRDTREIFNQGFAERLDVDKVSVQLGNLRTEKVKLQNQLDAGNAALKFLMNMPQNDVLILTDSITEESIKSNLLDTAYNYSDRKEYQLLEAALRLNRYNIKRHKLSYLPTVAVFANYSKNAQRNEFDFFGKGDWFTTSLVGLRINVPIFDGFAKRSRITRAKLEMEKTQNNLEQLRGSIDNDVARSRLSILSAIATMDNQRRNMELAEQVYNTTRKKYEQGLGSNQEIYNAQAELKVAQNNYYSALYDAIIARIDFLQAAGKL